MAIVTETRPVPEALPFSLLDTDLYKLTMQCAVLKYFPNTHVEYAFTNRTPHMKLNRKAFDWLKQQVDGLGDISLTPEELDYLRRECPYFGQDYLSFLNCFRMKPREQVELGFEPVKRDLDRGDVQIKIRGLWKETIVYEIPLLALISEAYFRFCDVDWSHDGQEQKAREKCLALLEDGCFVSEFGTRRRRDYQTQDLVVKGLCDASAQSEKEGLPGKLVGTSNVHFSMKYGISPVGTVAHEWYMGIAAITDDYENSNEIALKYWLETFGEGVLAIALTDTFGTSAFFEGFGRSASSGSMEVQSTKPQDRSYARIFTGIRQDSGDPATFVRRAREFYHSMGIKDEKVIVFSDSLNIELCLEYKTIAEAAGFKPSFGVGTFFTNDFIHKLDGRKSIPLNIVIKLSRAGGRPAIKISDDIGKNTGDEQVVREVKSRLGYIE